MHVCCPVCSEQRVNTWMPCSEWTPATSSISLSCTHTHTYTHTLSDFKRLVISISQLHSILHFISHTLSLPLMSTDIYAVDLSHAHTHTHTHTHTSTHRFSPWSLAQPLTSCLCVDPVCHSVWNEMLIWLPSRPPVYQMLHSWFYPQRVMIISIIFLTLLPLVFLPSRACF